MDETATGRQIDDGAAMDKIHKVLMDGGNLGDVVDGIVVITIMTGRQDPDGLVDMPQVAEAHEVHGNVIEVSEGE